MDTQTNSAESRPERFAFSIADFCYRNDISISTYHKLKNAGLGPKEMRLGCLVRISIEEEAAWRAARSNPKGAEAKTRAALLKMASERGKKAGRLPTGPASGIDVLDLDFDEGKGKNGLAEVPDWQDRSPIIVRTPRGGAHLWFKSDVR